MLWLIQYVSRPKCEKTIMKTIVAWRRHRKTSNLQLLSVKGKSGIHLVIAKKLDKHTDAVLKLSKV